MRRGEGEGGGGRGGRRVERERQIEGGLEESRGGAIYVMKSHGARFRNIRKKSVYRERFPSDFSFFFFTFVYYFLTRFNED